MPKVHPEYEAGYKEGYEAATNRYRLGWQPIETAPRNGELILVYNPTWIEPVRAERLPREREGRLIESYWLKGKAPALWRPLPLPPTRL